MSHVDSGALHAYLDGALDEYPASDANRIRGHLDACAECAGRLEEARAVRAAAQGILDQAVPSVDLPSLEELRAYVKATRPEPSRLSVTIYRLGWAASVVLAVGVGWVARGGQPALTDVQMAPIAVPSPAEAVDQDVVFAPSAERQRSDSDEGVPALAPAATVAAGSLDASTEMAEELPAAPAEPDFAATLDEIVAEADVDDMFRELETADPEAITVADVVASGAGARFGQEARSIGNRIEVVPAPEPVAAEEEARRAAPTDRREISAQLNASSATGLRQAELPEAEAEFEDDEIEFDAIPGVEVLSFAQLDSGAGHALVQRLENGMMVDVYHILDPEAAPDEVLPEDSGRNEVRQQRETGWIVLRSEASLTELRELLARFPAGS